MHLRASCRMYFEPRPMCLPFAIAPQPLATNAPPPSPMHNLSYRVLEPMGISNVSDRQTLSNGNQL